VINIYRALVSGEICAEVFNMRVIKVLERMGSQDKRKTNKEILLALFSGGSSEEIFAAIEKPKGYSLKTFGVKFFKIAKSIDSKIGVRYRWINVTRLAMYYLRLFVLYIYDLFKLFSKNPCWEYAWSIRKPTNGAR
jgi:hypothetical protein